MKRAKRLGRNTTDGLRPEVHEAMQRSMKKNAGLRKRLAAMKVSSKP